VSVPFPSYFTIPCSIFDIQERWWLSRRVSLEREMCTDELAVAATGRRLTYATALEQLGRKRLGQTAPQFGATMGGKKMVLLDRVSNTLGFSVSPKKARWWPVGLLGLLVPLAIWAASTGIARPEPAPIRAGEPSDPAPRTPWAEAVIEAFPQWETVRCDRSPSVQIGSARGYRLLLRQGRREYTGQPMQQKASPAAEGEIDENDFRTVYSHIDVVVFPLNEKLPEKATQAIAWEDVEQEWYVRGVDLGSGHGYRWFTRTTLFWQEDLRTKLGLIGGDDRLQLLIDGLLTKDRGDCTANSLVTAAAKVGDPLIPHIEAALQKITEEDHWRLVQPLGRIDTPRATELLTRLYRDEKTRHAASYALISGPPRESAKELYFDLLRRRQYIYQVAEACVAFDWKDSIGLMQAICDRPTSWEFRSAFRAKRMLEGRPVPEELDEAENVLRSAGPRADPAQIEAARRTLLSAPDKEAAAIVAAHLTDFLAKANHDEIEAVRRLGRELLEELPGEVTIPLMKRLAANFEYEWQRERLQQTLQSLESKPPDEARLLEYLRRNLKRLAETKLPGHQFTDLDPRAMKISWKTQSYVVPMPSGKHADAPVEQRPMTGPAPDGLIVTAWLSDTIGQADRPQVLDRGGFWKVHLGQAHLPGPPPYLLFNVEYGPKTDEKLIEAFTSADTWLAALSPAGQADPSGWGEPVQGLLCRVRGAKTSWRFGDILTFRADLHNAGPKIWALPPSEELYEIEVAPPEIPGELEL